jgi:hypothetical protein
MPDVLQTGGAQPREGSLAPLTCRGEEDGTTAAATKMSPRRNVCNSRHLPEALACPTLCDAVTPHPARLQTFPPCFALLPLRVSKAAPACSSLQAVVPIGLSYHSQCLSTLNCFQPPDAALLNFQHCQQ